MLNGEVTHCLNVVIGEEHELVFHTLQAKCQPHADAEGALHVRIDRRRCMRERTWSVCMRVCV